MTGHKFYIEEEGIIFESFDEDPDLAITDSTYCEGTDILLRCFCVREAAPMAKEVCSENRYVTVDIGKLRKAGVPEYVISMILDSEEELSTLRITQNARILLPEYKLEIRMPPLDKALYFLFLRHPEGIRFKELCDHRDELSDLYSSITGRTDPEQIRDSIEALTDPLSNSINEKCSRIKRAFTKAFSEALARNYYIDGKGGGPKSIALDRSLVVWETLKI